MTIPNWTDFQNAYNLGEGDPRNPDNCFTAKVSDHQKTVNQYGTDLNNYSTGILAHFQQLLQAHQPELALMYFFYYLSSSVDSNTHDNMLGLFDDQVKGWGQSMAVNAYAGKLNSLLTDLTDDSVSQSQVGITSQVTVANQAVALLTLAYQSQPVQSALDPSEITTVVSQLQMIQKTLGQYFDPNPNANPATDQKITSFDEMKTLLGQPGDVKNSADAAKALTDFSAKYWDMQRAPP